MNIRENFPSFRGVPKGRSVFREMKLLSILLILTSVLFAQEPQKEGFYKANIDSLYIRWSHHAEADTFWVYKGSQSLEFITNANMRTVWYNQPQRYKRLMATHHLREYILNSPLKFENLDALAKGNNSKLKEYFIKY